MPTDIPASVGIKCFPQISSHPRPGNLPETLAIVAGWDLTLLSVTLHPPLLLTQAGSLLRDTERIYLTQGFPSLCPQGGQTGSTEESVKDWPSLVSATMVAAL